MSIIQIADIVRFQVDAGVIGYFMPESPENISIFGVGTRLTSIAYFAVGVIGSVLMPRFSGLKRQGAIRRRGAGVELASLSDRAARQLAAADASWEPKVVLDAPRRSGLTAECGALNDQRFETFRSPVYGGGETSWPGTDDQEVDLFTRCELKSNPERAHQVARQRLACHA